MQRQAAIDAVGALKVPLLAAVEAAGKSKETSVGKSEVGAPEGSEQRNSTSPSDTSTRSSEQRTTRSKVKKGSPTRKSKRKS